MFFSGAYLLLILFVIIEIMASKPDGMFGVVMMFLAMPSVILLFALPETAPDILGFPLYVFCLLLNAAMFYFVGVAFGAFGSWIKRQIDRQNEWASKKR